MGYLRFGLRLGGLLAVLSLGWLQAAPAEPSADAADAAWNALIRASRPLAPPPEWQGREPTEAEIAKLRAQGVQETTHAADLAKDFYTRWPSHANGMEARVREYVLLDTSFQYGGTSQVQRLFRVEDGLLADPKINPRMRMEILGNSLRRAPAFPRLQFSAQLDRVEAAARKLQENQPRETGIYKLLNEVASYRLRSDDIAKARLTWEGVARTAPAQSQERAVADAQLIQFQLLGKPLDVKFKAMDGREVDLQKMRGKVVLIDFWATWCGPCMASLPHLKETYRKLQPKGFEVVGINLDTQEQMVSRVVDQQKIPWPQYFEESEQNRFATAFGIVPIPTVWLVDKAGRLRELNGLSSLEEKVDKLLAESL